MALYQGVQFYRQSPIVIQVGNNQTHHTFGLQEEHLHKYKTQKKKKEKY